MGVFVHRWRIGLLCFVLLVIPTVAFAQLNPPEQTDVGFESIKAVLESKGLNGDEIAELGQHLEQESFLEKLKPDRHFHGIDIYPHWDYDIDGMVYIYRQMKYVQCLKDNTVHGLDAVEQTLHHIRMCGTPPERPPFYWKPRPMPKPMPILPKPIWPDPIWPILPDWWPESPNWKWGDNIHLLQDSIGGQNAVPDEAEAQQVAPSRQKNN